MSDAFLTDKGNVRDINQDYLDYSFNLDNDKLYILCDGMGGYKGGEIAAFECAKLIKNDFEKSRFLDLEDAKKWLYETILKANKKINSLAKKNSELEKMGTTVVCFLVTSRFKLFASVGDSRIYAYNHKELTKLSEDQTFAYALLKAGYISEKEAEIHPKKNILLCAIGSNEEDLDVQIKEVNGKHNYLLCSDGLYNMIENKEILKIINSNDDINSRAKKLIDLANNNGGKDNISVILVEDLV